MSIDPEVLDYFHNNFGVVENSKLPSKTANLPEILVTFYNRFGFGMRSDGFLWITDPREYFWVNSLFSIDSNLFLFARNSFGDLYFLDYDGSLFFFSPSYRNMERISTSIDSSIMTISEKEFTDEDMLIGRHKEMWGASKHIDNKTCYCFSPAIPLGGDEETSDIYIGDLRVYFELLRQF